MFKSGMLLFKQGWQLDSFSLFFPAITGKYLFIFDKLEEDNILLFL